MSKIDFPVDDVLNKKRPVIEPLEKRISKSALERFETLSDAEKNLYRLEKCAICSLDLDVKIINDIIKKGKPPLCKEHDKKLTEQLAQVSSLFENLRL